MVTASGLLRRLVSGSMLPVPVRPFGVGYQTFKVCRQKSALTCKIQGWQARLLVTIIDGMVGDSVPDSQPSPGSRPTSARTVGPVSFRTSSCPAVLIIGLFIVGRRSMSTSRALDIGTNGTLRPTRCLPGRGSRGASISGFRKGREAICLCKNKSLRICCLKEPHSLSLDACVGLV